MARGGSTTNGTYPVYPIEPSGSGGGGANLVPIVLLVVGLLVAGGVIVWSVAGGGGSTTTATAPQEFFLEPAASTGANPFTTPLDPPPTPTTLATATSTASAPTTVAPVSQPTSGVMPATGSTPYGGTGDNAVCDPAKLTTFLTDPANSAAATAFAGALGIAVADIAGYVGRLSPAQLLYDTRVTNHGLTAGRATPFQAVLQAGTAVLVDQSGTPRVRCRCGNPLLPAVPLTNPTPQPAGTSWPGYTPAGVVTVVDGKTAPMPMTPTAGASSGGASTTTAAVSATTGPGGTAPTTTSGGGSGTGDTGEVEGLKAVFAECPAIDTLVILDVQKDPDLAGALTVRAQVNGATMIFVYNTTTGDIAEGDRASAELLATCNLDGPR